MRKRIEVANITQLAAQQEIKNYQDSLNFVLQSIRELKETVDHVHQEQLENYAALHSSYVGLQGEVSALKDLLFSRGLWFQNALKDQKISLDIDSKKIADLEKDFRFMVNNEDILKAELDYTIQRFTTLKTAVESIEQKIAQDINNISNVYQKDIQRTKEEILSLPCKSDTVRKELTEKIESHKVDVAGIMRELTIYKHDNHITEKKIENIYTLIERLNQR